MNREETFERYNRAQKEGIHIWNDWANEMLAEKKRLFETGEWSVDEKEEPKNDQTRTWYDEAKADFSTLKQPHTFEDDINFSGLIFPGKTQFSGAKFKGIAFFNKTRFHGKTHFINANFSHYVIFMEAIFKEKTWFNGSVFLSISSFNYTVFIQSVSFNTTVFKRFVSFQNAIFKDISNFRAIRAENAFSLKGVKFSNKVPDFHQANFAEAPHLEIVNICPTPRITRAFRWERYFWSKNFSQYLVSTPDKLINSCLKFPWSQFTNIHRDPEDEAKYRALKRLAIQAHDHENEQKFWAGEIRARRHIKDFINPFKKGPASTVRYIGGMFYALLSDFGRSIWRPVFFWSVLVYAMTCVHLSAHKHLQNPPTPQETTRVKYPSDPKADCNPSWSALHVSLKTSSLGLGFDRTKSEVYKDHYRCLYPTKNSSLKIPDNILIYEFVQMLISAVLIFLLLLGIRNNFKLK